MKELKAIIIIVLAEAYDDLTPNSNHFGIKISPPPIKYN